MNDWGEKLDKWLNHNTAAYIAILVVFAIALLALGWAMLSKQNPIPNF